MPLIRSLARKKCARMTTKIGATALSIPAAELSSRSSAHAVRTLGSHPLKVPSTTGGTQLSLDRFVSLRVARTAIQRIVAASNPRTPDIVNAGTDGTATFISRNVLPHMRASSPSSTQMRAWVLCWLSPCVVD